MTIRQEINNVIPLTQQYIVPHILSRGVMDKFQCFDEKCNDKRKIEDKSCTEWKNLSL